MKTSKKLLSVFLALIMITSIIPMSSITASAATSGTCGDNLTWTFDETTGILSISGTGAMTNCYSTSSPWDSNGGSITSVKIGDGVASIGNYAFYGCTSLTSVTIGDGVASIGNYAFYNCTSLTSVTIPDSVTSIGNGAFNRCSDLLNVKIGEGVKTIGSSAFSTCDSLIKVIIPDSVITIDAQAFYNCANLTKVTIGDSVTTIGDNAFYSCENLTNVKIGNSVTSIGQAVFSQCTSLKNVTIPDSVTSIGEGAFQRCTSITSVTIPGSVMSIGNSAFSNCTGLTSVIIEDGVMTIGNAVFQNCKGLTDITIPNSVISIGVSAFNVCNSLTDVYYLGTEEEWNEIVIGNTNVPLLNATIHFIYDEEHVCSYDDGVVTKAPTCTNDGVKTYTCIDCGNTYTETISATGTHVYVTETERVNPTCTADGYVTMSCGCGATEITTLSATGHTSKTITVPATCTVSGMEYNVCEICGETIGDSTVIPALGHTAGDEVVENATESTCSQSGSYDIAVYCTVCGCEISRETIIVPVRSHEYESEITTSPTCTKTGIKTYTCTACGNSYTEEIPATGHTTKSVNIPATCTVSGMEYNVCEICGETIGDSTVIPAKGHTAGEWETILEPTYEADGKKVQKCTVCGEVVAEEVIPMLVKIVVTDENTDISIEVKGDEYNGVVDIVVEESFDGTAFDVIDTSLNASQKFIYDITMTVDGVVTQPTGTVTVRIPLPAGYDPNRSFVYHVNTETGTVEKMPATYENGYLVFETTHFSYYAVVEEGNYTFSIQSPSRTEIRNKDGIILHAVVDGTAPSGSYVKWESSNGNFDKSADGSNLKIIANNKGWTTFTAILSDADGNELARDSVEMYSKSGFFDKIGGFFRSLFGTTKIYEN